MTACATCGACCRSYVVPVCGYDVWLLTRRQRLAPEQFVVAYGQKPGSAPREAFRLEPDGPLFGLALDKRGRFKPSSPCVFLYDLAGGLSRCGVYAERPVVCETYPMAMWAGVISQREKSLCPPEAWSEADIQDPTWRTGLQRLRFHFDIYHEVVARWNAAVASGGRARVLPEFYAYLLNLYDRLASLDAECGPERLDQIRATWPGRPHPPSLSIVEGEEPDWFRYFISARQIIDSVYPSLPAQPPLLLSVAESDP
jgi:Fe-S-cluster containining protein